MGPEPAVHRRLSPTIIPGEPKKLADRLAAVRQSVTASGLDASVVDEAIAAAHALD